VLQQALQQYPDDLNLLYTRAMLAEKRNDLAQMEKDLRLIIKRDPDNAMALNALGYTLSDRTTRYAEAKALIEQAHQINPEDPAVLDSLGWVNPPGQPTKPNACCARRSSASPTTKSPHLGEVCGPMASSAKPNKSGAKFLKEQPDSPILRSTIKRLTGSETL
jgi:tetratricopeptide (TPR) repeat protein